MNMSSQVVRQILCGWSIPHQTRYHGCLKSLTSWEGNPSIVQKAFISTSELCFSCTGDALWLDLCHCVSKRLKEKQKAFQSSAPGTRSKAVKSRTSAPNNMGAMSTAQRLNLRKKWVNVCGGKGETYPPLETHREVTFLQCRSWFFLYRGAGCSFQGWYLWYLY